MKHKAALLKAQQNYNKRHPEDKINFLTSPRTRRLMKYTLRYLDHFPDARFYFTNNWEKGHYQINIQIGVDAIHHPMGVCRPTFYSNSSLMYISCGNHKDIPLKLYGFKRTDTEGQVRLTNELLELYSKDKALQETNND